MIVLITGVCGSGKTSTGQALASKLLWSFEDADHFHSTGNIKKMEQGIPLSDEDRIPWLLSLNEVIESWRSSSRSGVLACSALKSSYRRIILHGLQSNEDPQNCHKQGSNVGSADHLVVLLQGSKHLIQDRMSQRTGHFMPPSLLDSQLAILEPLETSRYSVTVNIDNTIDMIVHEIVKKIEDIL